jgi:hypothetical protein
MGALHVWFVRNVGALGFEMVSSLWRGAVASQPNVLF